MILFGIDRAVIYPLPVSSLCPPPVLLFLCSRPGTDHQKDGVSQALSCFFRPGANSSSPSVSGLQYFLFRVFSHLSPPLSVFTLHFPCFFSTSFLPTAPPPPPLPVCCSLCVSPSLPQSIINFNLRAGLNGTIRERSMLSIWMPARLDLGIPHQRRRLGEIAVCSSLRHHIHTSPLIQIIDQTPECKR